MDITFGIFLILFIVLFGSIIFDDAPKAPYIKLQNLKELYKISSSSNWYMFASYVIYIKDSDPKTRDRLYFKIYKRELLLYWLFLLKRNKVMKEKESIEKHLELLKDIKAKIDSENKKYSPEDLMGNYKKVSEEILNGK